MFASCADKAELVFHGHAAATAKARSQYRTLGR